MPKLTQFIITKLGATRVSEPEVKFIFFVLFFLGGLASTAKSEAVLPAYLVGLVVAGVFLRDKTLRPPDAEHCVHDLHPVLLHQGGTFRFAARIVGVASVSSTVLLLMKLATKFIGVWAAHQGFLHAQPRGELHHAA